MNPCYCLSFIALAQLVEYPAIAADNETDVIVVTATRQATKESELLCDVSVISREEIEQAGQSTIEQLLNRQPGIQYSANGGPGTSSGLYIRGTNSNQSIVLIDGQRVGSATTGSAALSRIPLSQIERIEILRGPASSLYGADAIGGVVQIFTRKGEGPAQLNASGGYGTYGTSETTVGISGGTEAIFFSLQGSYYNTDGFNAINNPTNSNYNSDDDGFHNGSITGSFSIRPAQGHEIGVNLFSSQGSNKYDSWGFGTPKNNDFKSDQDVSSYSVFSRNVFHPVWTSTLRFGNSIDDSKNYSNGSRTGVFRTSQDQFGWQNDIKLPVGKALLAAEYLRQSVSGSSVDYTVDERTVTSLLAGWTGDIDDHRFQLNLRDDDNSQFGRKTTGSVTYGYQFTPELRAHVAYGTAFRAPTFNELYYPDYGNGNLNPETSSNTEVGFNWASGDHRFFGVVYNNEVSDLIQTGPAPMYAPENISKALLRGASLTYDGRISNWTTGVSLDWLDPRNEGKGANNGNLLVRRARQQMNSYLGRSFGNLEIRGEWQLVGKRYNDVANTQVLGGYGLVNLYADYHLQKDWSVFVRGNNIFNKYYETAGDYSTAGASIFAGIRYQPK